MRKLQIVLLAAVFMAFSAGMALAAPPNGDLAIDAVRVIAAELAAANYYAGQGFPVPPPGNNTANLGMGGGGLSYVLGVPYVNNDDVDIYLKDLASTFKTPGTPVYYLVTENPLASGTYSCLVNSGVQPFSMITGGPNNNWVKFRASASTAFVMAADTVTPISAFGAGIKYWLSSTCNGRIPVAIDTAPLTTPCTIIQAEIESTRWFGLPTPVIIDKAEGIKKITVMESNRQFGGSMSNKGQMSGPGLFNAAIACPSQDCFYDPEDSTPGTDCHSRDLYGKIMCGATTNCTPGCGGNTINDPYIMQPTDYISVTIHASQPFEDGCWDLDAMGSMSPTGDINCVEDSPNAGDFTCQLTQAFLLDICPSWPTSGDCLISFKARNAGKCKIAPRYFKNTKDNIVINGGNIILDKKPIAPADDAGYWNIAGVWFTVPYAYFRPGYETYCFINNHAMSETVAWIDFVTLESCAGETDGCYLKLQKLQGLDLGKIPAKGVKRVDISSSLIKTYNWATGGDDSAVDKTYNLTALGVQSRDRAGINIWVCNNDQWAGYWQGVSNGPGFDQWDNNWPGTNIASLDGQNNPWTGATWVQCFQDAGTANSRRNNDVYTSPGRTMKK